MLLFHLQPRLHSGVLAYCCLPHGDPIPPTAICHFAEDEGVTIILPLEDADRMNLKVGYQAEWITLDVQSDLASVGLTAKVSTTLAHAGISCNIVAGYHHDHLFVPAGKGYDALIVLLDLQAHHEFVFNNCRLPASVGEAPAACPTKPPSEP